MSPPKQSEVTVAARQRRLARRYKRALNLLREDRTDVDAWVELAEIALAGEVPQRAKEVIAKARVQGAGGLRLDAVEARSDLLAGDRAAAREKALALAGILPEDALDCDTIGVLLVRSGEVARALPFFERAVSRNPDSAQFRYNLGTTLQFLGRLDEARAQLAEVLQIDPDFAKARLALVQIDGAHDDMLPDLVARFDRESTGATEALQLGHAVAKICERAGDDAAALGWLRRAKAGKAETIEYRKEWVDRLFVAAATSLEEARQVSQEVDDDMPAPLFVTGMPRSGTTLVERILACHPKIESAGELSDFALAARRNAGASTPEALSPEVLQAKLDLADIGERYRQQTEPLRSANAAFLIDKMPFNLFFISRILQSLAEARVLMVRRDPRDVVIANYRQLFATDFGYYDYAYRLDWAVHFVSRFEVLADRAHALLAGPRYRQIRYEALTIGLEGEAREMIGWLNLDWSDDCLEFHRSDEAVTTASSVQVRSPVHRKSVERWRRYGQTSEWLEDEMERELAAARSLLT